MIRLLVLFFFFHSKSHAVSNTNELFRGRLSEDMGTLDWNYGEVNSEIIYQIMEGLFRGGSTGLPELALAERVQFSADHKNLKIWIRKNHQWSDGKSVCAMDFINSWNRLRSKEFGSPYAHYAQVIKNIEAKGCGFLSIEFVRECPEALSLLSHYVFFPLRIDQLNASPKAFVEAKGLLTNGPFKISSWMKNQKISLIRNAQFKREKVIPHKLAFFFLPEDSTAKIMFDRGDLDWMRAPPPLLITDRSLVRVFPSFTVYYFGLNSTGASILEALPVRKMLRKALSLEALPSILGAENKPVFQWVPTQLLGLNPIVIEKESIAVDPYIQKMKEQLKIRVYSKSQPKLLAEWAQGQWEKKLNVRIPIEVQESKIYWKEISTNPAPIFLSGVTAPFAHPRAFLQEFFPNSSANWISWKSKEYELLVERGKYMEAELLLAQSSWILPLYQRDFSFLIQSHWKGFHINPLGQIYLSQIK